MTDPAHARALARAAGRRPLPVHIAVDTGMHRSGTDAGAAPAVAEMLRLPGLEVRGLFTHLAVADSPAPEDAPLPARSWMRLKRWRGEAGRGVRCRCCTRRRVAAS